MDRKWEELTDEFDAEAGDGTRVHILVYTKKIDARGMGGKPDILEGLKRAVTTDGQECNHIDDDTFEIVESGVRVQRIR